MHRASQRDLEKTLAELDRQIGLANDRTLPAIVAALSARIGLASAKLLSDTPPPSQSTNRNLDVSTAALRLGVSVTWLYKKAGQLPFTVRIGRRVLFSETGLNRWIKQRSGRA